MTWHPTGHGPGRGNIREVLAIHVILWIHSTRRKLHTVGAEFRYLRTCAYAYSLQSCSAGNWLIYGRLRKFKCGWVRRVSKVRPRFKTFISGGQILVTYLGNWYEACLHIVSRLHADGWHHRHTRWLLCIYICICSGYLGTYMYMYVCMYVCTVSWGRGACRWAAPPPPVPPKEKSDLTLNFALKPRLLCLRNRCHNFREGLSH